MGPGEWLQVGALVATCGSLVAGTILTPETRRPPLAFGLAAAGWLAWFALVGPLLFGIEIDFWRHPVAYRILTTELHWWFIELPAIAFLGVCAWRWAAPRPHPYPGRKLGIALVVAVVLTCAIVALLFLTIR